MIPLTQFGVLFVAVLSIAIFVLPRKWAAAPLFVGVCYMTLSQGVAIGPFNFFVIRILVLVGLIRVLIRKERLPFGMNRLDWLMLAWAAWGMVAPIFRDYPAEVLTGNLGRVYNACGLYFLLRIFITSTADLKRLCCFVAVVLIPVALEMSYEQFTGRNLFSILSSMPEQVSFREGHFRSRGPFSHAILAGSVGGIFLPIALSLRRFHRRIGLFAVVACCVIVVTSFSSGPLMSAIFALSAVVAWRFRQHMGLLRWGAAGSYLGLAIVMNAPVYFLLARIDLTGGSTGWHRAQLIDSAIRHLPEWWLGGTDYTRHWMPTGVSWSPDHTDITNHYLALGVDGGLTWVVLFVAIIWTAFSMLGSVVRQAEQSSERWGRFYWALGASLFASAATGIAVSFFDQSFAFIYLVLAGISAANGAIYQQAPPVSSAREAGRNTIRSRRGVSQPRTFSSRARRRDRGVLREE